MCRKGILLLMLREKLISFSDMKDLHVFFLMCLLLTLEWKSPHILEQKAHFQQHTAHFYILYYLSSSILFPFSTRKGLFMIYGVVFHHPEIVNNP